jgi:hypothetical protein
LGQCCSLDCGEFTTRLTVIIYTIVCNLQEVERLEEEMAVAKEEEARRRKERVAKLAKKKEEEAAARQREEEEVSCDAAIQSFVIIVRHI